MKMRLFVCVALAMMVAGASALSSGLALAQGEQAKGRSQQAERDGARSEDSSSSIDKALQAYDERMDRDLDKCRHDLEQMKKELHELIDLRLGMAMSVAELRARNSMQGGPFGRSGDEEGATRSAGERGEGPHGRGAGVRTPRRWRASSSSSTTNSGPRSSSSRIRSRNWPPNSGQ